MGRGHNYTTRLGIILLLLAIFISNFAYATTYYVDSSDGADSNNGLSQDKAFKGLEYAVSKLKGGDTLYLLEGNYYSSVPIELSNMDLNSPIKIGAYSGHTATIKSNIAKYESPTSGLWTKVSDTSLNMWSSPLDSVNSEFIAQYSSSKVSLFSYTSNSQFRDPKNPEGIYYDSAANKMYVRFDDSSKNPNNFGLIISGNFNFNFYKISGAGLVISDLSFVGGTRCINIDESENIEIEGNTCTGAFLGISVKTSKNVNIHHNTLTMKRGDFPYKNMKGSLYETSGIFLQDDLDGVKVSYNKVTGHFNGILTYSTSTGKFSNANIYNNVIKDIYDDAIEIEDYCNGASYHHNNISDSFVGFSLSPANAEQKRCHIYNNIIVANKADIWDTSGEVYTGECFKIIASSSTQNINYTKNTCIGRAIYSIEADTHTQKNSIWKENIFYSKDEKLILVSGLASDGVVYDYNLYYRADGGILFQYWNSDTSTTEFLSLSSALSSSNWNDIWDIHSKNLNPLFKDIGKYDVRLSDNSPGCKMSATGGYVGALPCTSSASQPPPAPSSSIITACALGDKTWAEDKGLTSAYDLNGCFDDPLNQQLKYSVKGNQSIIVKINSGIVSFTTPNNYYGSDDVYFTATSGNRTAKTNTVTLTVTPVVECGDSVCQQGETCNSCSKDCGVCTSNTITACTLGDKTWKEDTTLSNAYNLKDCFYDPLDKELKFSVKGLNSIDVAIKSDSSVELSAPANWYGSEEVYFTATSGNRTAKTNTFVLKVSPSADCGDDVCDAKESCSVCSADCGACPVDTGSGGSGNTDDSTDSTPKRSGGGGGSSKSYITLPKEETPEQDDDAQELIFIDTAATTDYVYQGQSDISFNSTGSKVAESEEAFLKDKNTLNPPLTNMEGITGLVTDIPEKRLHFGNILFFLVVAGAIYLFSTHGLPILAMLKNQKIDANSIEQWKGYLAQHEAKGISIEEVRNNLVSTMGYDGEFMDLVIKVYMEDKFNNIDNKAKKEWYKYFASCIKKGIQLSQMKDYLVLEKGYHGQLVDSLLYDFQKNYNKNN